ncbi:MAG: GNAT family N-acetyltransferase [Luteitalea sp.]|nr:GNAT family N-acetyltransferase [Luteitalea sp.]
MTVPASLIIRPATPDDAPLIVTFIRALAAYERLEQYVTVTEQGVRDALSGPHPATEALVAETDGEPVGYAFFFHTFSTFLGQRALYLEDLFVVPEARSQGIGQALLGRVAQIALERGCGRVEWAVLDWNAPAIRFYHRLGAQPIEGWTVYRLSGPAMARTGRLGPEGA